LNVVVIGRSDLSGLGYMTRDFCNHVNVSSALIVEREGRGQNRHEDINANHVMPTREIAPLDLRWLLRKADVLVGFETFYDSAVIPAAVVAGVKTVMFPMWECSPPEVAAADLLFCVTEKEVQRFRGLKGTRVVACEWPMDTPAGWRKQIRQSPLRVVANAGSGGLHDRNNVAVLEAIRKIDHAARTNEGGNPLGWRFSLNEFSDARGRWEQYAGADVFVHLQAFQGLSLPLLEAAACGVPCVACSWADGMTCTVPAFQGEAIEMMGQRVEFQRPTPETVAEVLDRLALSPAITPPAPPISWDEFLEAYWRPNVRFPWG
jgi:hypothetical protein